MPGKPPNMSSVRHASCGTLYPYRVNSALKAAGTVSDLFWPTAATVIPVLALALVVEARATIARWNDDVPWWVRSSQGLLWVYVLIVFAIVESVAFNDLAGNETSGAWAIAAQRSIVQSIIVLLVTPAVGLLARSNARAIARTVGRIFDTPYQWRILKVSLNAQRSARELDTLREDLKKQLARIIAVENEIRVDGPVDEHYAQVLAEVESIKQEISNGLGRVEEKKRTLLDIRTKLDDIKKEVAQRRKKFA
jgi:hypothetical protein